MVKLDFESRTKCDPGEWHRLSSSGCGSDMARLFVGSNSKGLCDLGSIDSPTSPLDLMMFSRLRGAIRSPRNRYPRLNSCDCIRTGLRGIVDHPDDDEWDLFGRALGSSCRKSIIFGHKLRLKELNGSDSSIVFEIGESDWLGNRAIGEGFLAGSDIDLSEDYTCVISRGPGSTTTMTRIFDDQVLECFHLNDLVSMTIMELPEGINPSSDPLNGFLGACYACKKPLVDGEDIYMYRGDKAFCCEECREKEILLEGDPEEILKPSGHTPRGERR